MNIEYEKEYIIKDFKMFLEELEIEENQITYEDVETYVTSLHYDLVNDCDNIEDVPIIEEQIENIICENFKI